MESQGTFESRDAADSHQPDLAVRLTELVRALSEDSDERGVLQRVVDAAVAEIPGADCAGIMVLTSTGAVTDATTHALVADVDDLQFRSGEGPCLDSAAGDGPVHAPDLRDEPRWPLFAPAAARLGVRSIVSYQLFTDRDSLGALNIYATGTGALGEDTDRIGDLLAAHAAAAMVATRERANLRAAISSRDLIGQAKGILMERHRIDAARAFDILVGASQRTHSKLRDVAEYVARTGSLPAAEHAPGLVGPEQRMTLTTRSAGRTALLTVAGSVDAASAAEFGAVVRRAAESHLDVVVDLGQVQVVAAAGLRHLTVADDVLHRAGGELHLVGARSTVCRALQVAGQGRAWRLHATVGEALWSLLDARSRDAGR